MQQPHWTRRLIARMFARPAAKPPGRRPRLEALEDRLTPTNWVAVGTSAGTVGRVQVWNVSSAAAPAQVGTTVAPFAGFAGGLRVALADVQGDATPELFVAPGPGSNPVVKIYQLTGGNFVEWKTIQAFGATFTRGIYIAVGDVVGDSAKELIVSQGRTGSGNGTINVINITTPTTRVTRSATALGIFGAKVAVGDVIGDDQADIVVTPEVGTYKYVSVFAGGATLPTVPLRFTVPNFVSQGMNVAVANTDGAGKDEIILGTVGVGSPRVHFVTFSDTGARTFRSIAASSAQFKNGVRVGAIDYDADGSFEVVAASGNGGSSTVRILNPVTAAQRGGFQPFSNLGATTRGFEVAGITF